MKLRYRNARWLFSSLQVIASILAFAFALPCIIFLLAMWALPPRDFLPSEVFHNIRRFVFRVFAGRTLRPITLRTSLPAGSSIRSRDNTTV